MKRIIIFLIRKRLGLKKFERFKFGNQKSPDNYYYFNDDCLIKKVYFDNGSSASVASNVSLNWLLNGECEIIRLCFHEKR